MCIFKRTIRSSARSRLWEDFQDQAVARARKNEPRESLASVRRRLIASVKLPKNA